MLRHIHKSLFIFTAIIMLVVFIFPTAVLSQSYPTIQPSQLLSVGDDPCSNLDVIFVVDQSSSMETNDKDDQRTNAIKSMIDLLIDLSIDQCPGSHHRIGMISFGNEGESYEDIKFTDIAPTSIEEASKLRVWLKDKVTAKSLGQTYPYQAFWMANQMFEKGVYTGDNDNIRKKVLVYITDGYPCHQDYGCDSNINEDLYIESSKSLASMINFNFPFSKNLNAKEKCFQELREQYNGFEIPIEDSNACSENLDAPVTNTDYENSTYLFVLSMSDDVMSGENNVLNQPQLTLQEVTNSHGGEYIPFIRNDKDIPTEMRRILSSLSGIQPQPLACGQFIVNPYLKKSVITAYKSSGEIGITLSYTDVENVTHSISKGEALSGFTPENTIYTEFGTNERYEFSTPYPGLWELESTNCDGVNVFFDDVSITPKEYNPINYVPKYDRDPFYNPNEPFFLEYQLTEANNSALIISQADDEIFAIDMSAVVTQANGTTNNYQLSWDKDAMVFRSLNPLLVPVPGQYTIDIKAESMRSPEVGKPSSNNKAEIFSERFKLFEVQNSSFTVGDFSVIEMELQSPQDGQNIGAVHKLITAGWPLLIEQIPVVVTMRTEDGRPLTDLNEIFKDPSSAVTATIDPLPRYDENGEVIPAILPDPMSVTLKIDPVDPSTLRGVIKDFDYEGSFDLTLTIDKDQIEKGFYSYKNDLLISGRRTDCLLCKESTYYGILAAILAVIALMILKYFLDKTNPLKGSISFIDGTYTIKEITLHNGKNRKNFGTKEFINYPQLELRSLVVRSVSKPKTSKTNDEMDFGYNFGSGSTMVEVSGVYANGRKLNPTRISADEQMAYTNDGQVRMIFTIQE